MRKTRHTENDKVKGKIGLSSPLIQLTSEPRTIETSEARQLLEGVIKMLIPTRDSNSDHLSGDPLSYQAFKRLCAYVLKKELGFSLRR